jgi:prepilin signal peptidase PulO-like enzyme (type II secretory pathway)
MSIILEVAVFVITFKIAWIIWVYVYKPGEMTAEKRKLSWTFVQNTMLKTESKAELAYRIITTCIAASAAVLFFQGIIVENTEYSIVIRLLLFFFALANICLLTYLTAFDIKHYEVPDRFTLYYIAFLLLANFVVWLATPESRSVLLWGSSVFSVYSNVLAAAIASAFIAAIVYFTKGKGMGSGDIRLAAIMGLLVGVRGILFGFYITVLSAALVGLIYGLVLRRFRKVRIPFVPFISWGIIVTLCFYPELNQLFESLFLL